MPWVKLDENFPDHWKLAELGDYAPLCGWLYICGLAFSNRQLRDGRIPKTHVPKLANFQHIGIETAQIKGNSGPLVSFGDDVETEMLAKLLVAVGLWEDRGDHFYIHDYLEFQPSREEVEQRRELKRRVGKLGGEASGKQRGEQGAKHGGEQGAKQLLK
ncbi:MAG: hypothetical protein E3J29_00170 [Dehalococcoidia bacterium]|nr:MAG: hypothetical protein E3J29_00170 [Dehalococcoidia bacterium]